MQPSPSTCTPTQCSSIWARDNGSRRCCQPPNRGCFPALVQTTPPVGVRARPAQRHRHIARPRDRLNRIYRQRNHTQPTHNHKPQTSSATTSNPIRPQHIHPRTGATSTKTARRKARKPRSTTGQVVVSFGADDRAARPLRASSGCPTATETGHTASKQATAPTKNGRHNPSRRPLGNPRHPSRPPPRPCHGSPAQPPPRQSYHPTAGKATGPRAVSRPAWPTGWCRHRCVSARGGGRPPTRQRCTACLRPGSTPGVR